MRLEEDFDEVKRGKTYAVAAVVCISVIVCILAVVLWLNRDSFGHKVNTSATVAYLESKGVSIGDNPMIDQLKEKKYKASDLDFFDMYKDRIEDASAPTETPTPEPTKNPAEDGNHTLLDYGDGKTEWVSISPYLTGNDYELSNFINRSGIMEYYQSGHKISYWGADISKDQDYVEFGKLSKAGMDFVMIRVGARGYESGEIILDEYFADNLKRATDAGLDVGLYFMSSAITEEEAVEEANAVIEGLKDYEIRYPIVWEMTNVRNDAARTDDLTKGEITDIARAFLGVIKENNKKAMVGGSKEWLIKKIELSKIISEYDIWLLQPEHDYPDYPYKYAMWQYTTQGTVDGIKGLANLNICMVDYSIK